MITQEQIEQAASQIYKDYVNYDNHYSNAYTYRQLGFIAGAQWALSQIIETKLTAPEDDKRLD